MLKAFRLQVMTLGNPDGRKPGRAGHAPNAQDRDSSPGLY